MTRHRPSTRSLRIKRLEDRRLLAVGDPDPTFDGDGLVQTELPFVMQAISQEVDGELYTVARYGPRLVRYDDNGQVDETFGGSDGVDLTGVLLKTDWIAASGDKIVVVGRSPTSFLRVELVQLDVNGELDPSFGAGGRLVTGISMPPASNNSPSQAGPPVLAIQGTKIVVAAPSGMLVTNAPADLLVARYLDNGTPDPDFGVAGRLVHDVNLDPDPDTVVISMAVDANEDAIAIFVYGVVSNTSLEAKHLLRIEEGQFDDDFGTNGVLPTDLWASVLAMHDGMTYIANDSGDEFGDFTVHVRRLDGQGQQDPEYGDEGLVSLNVIGTGGDATDFNFAGQMAIGTDGKAVILADTTAGARLVRLTPDGLLDTEFSGDGIAPAVMEVPGGFALRPDLDIVVYGPSLSVFPATQGELAMIVGFDSDGDGMGDSVDVQPAVASNDFSDGSTTGTITTRGDQILTVANAPNPAEGVLITARLSGGATAARIDGDGGTMFLTPGDQVLYTHGSMILDVLSGPVEVVFVAADGQVASAALATGIELTFEPETFTFIAAETNPQPVEVLVDGVELTVSPGQTVHSVQVDIRPESLNVDSNGALTVVIFGAAGFSATQIDVATVRFAGAAAWQFSLIDVNSDGLLDLQLKFRRQDTILDQIYAQLLTDDFDGDGILDSTRQVASVSVTGQTLDDEYFAGSDDVNLFLSGRALRDLLTALFG